MLRQMLDRYEVASYEQQEHALREVMQEIALAGLYRGGFFEKAAFYGGTCLRIFHQLPRFSEDLDFSLLRPDSEFGLDQYFKVVEAEFNSLGINITISKKKKTAQTAIESAFLKNTTQVFDVTANNDHAVKIKFEVDTQSPLGFATENRLLLEPFSFFVRCFQLPDLFAGKMHALLFRKWKNRIKGRDWFDFEWYVRKGVAMRLAHFNERALQSGDIDEPVDEAAFRILLARRIASVDINNAKHDIARFVTDAQSLEIWSSEYFLVLSEKMRIA